MFINKKTGKKLECCGYSVIHSERRDVTGTLKEEKTEMSCIFKDAYAVKPGDILEDEYTHEVYVVSDSYGGGSFGLTLLKDALLDNIKNALLDNDNKKVCKCNEGHSGKKEPVKYKITIESDGIKDTIASYEVDGELKDIKTSKCHCEDTFDFKEGAQVAFKRLMGKEVENATKERYGLPFACGMDYAQEGDIVQLWCGDSVVIFGKVCKPKKDNTIFSIKCMDGSDLHITKRSTFKMSLIWRE